MLQMILKINNRVIEYVASCSFTVNCEDASKDTNVVALLEAQVDLSKRIIRIIYQ